MKEKIVSAKNRALEVVGKKKKYVYNFHHHILHLFILWSFLAFAIFTVSFLLLSKEYKNSLERTQSLASQYYYWKSIVQKHPNFPDALIQAGVYANALGYKKEALEFIDSALLYDPNSVHAVAIRKKILQETIIPQ